MESKHDPLLQTLSCMSLAYVPPQDSAEAKIYNILIGPGHDFFKYDT